MSLRPAAPWSGAAIGQLGLLPAALAGDSIVLPDGRRRAVLEITPLNSGLLDERAATALEDGYRSVLASLTFPTQILLRSQPTGAITYLRRLRARLGVETDRHMLRLLLDHIAFVERQLAVRPPLERHAYLVVPAEDTRALPGPRWRWGRRAAPSGGPRAAREAEESAAQTLSERCAHLTRGLETLGLEVRRLRAPELAALLYSCLCPRLCRVQPLPPAALSALDTPIVTRARPSRPRTGAGSAQGDGLAPRERSAP